MAVFLYHPRLLARVHTHTHTHTNTHTHTHTHRKVFMEDRRKTDMIRVSSNQLQWAPVKAKIDPRVEAEGQVKERTV